MSRSIEVKMSEITVEYPGIYLAEYVLHFENYPVV